VNHYLSGLNARICPSTMHINIVERGTSIMENHMVVPQKNKKNYHVILGPTSGYIFKGKRK